MSGQPTATEIIAALGLLPHPEGGHYRETFRDPREAEGRSASSLIYYLLAEGEASHWHRIDAAEIWHWYAGAPLELRIHTSETRRVVPGGDVLNDQQPQAAVRTRAWQAARSLGAWTLVGCTVAPAFDFKSFEMAPSGWEP